ncbi:hypothetical protein MB09_01570 [Aequorivita vladivostokensis]|uniref:Uncharacterized protein n=1 Tax=Aequorivita vladivostokensis TaxID=171194 RepID=A0ABR5DM81_9FLAO|nr:hypothetical protein MB09_01570 [Aequorivita vladivostokensis]
MEATYTDLYIKGFNNGYFLAKYNPSLIEQLVQTESNIEYIGALRDGSRTFHLEIKKNKISELANLRSRNLGKKDMKR